MSEYRSKKSLQERLKECNSMKQKYPDRICVYLYKNPSCKNLEDIEKKKFLVPTEITIGQFMCVVRKRLNINNTTSIYIFTEQNTIPCSTDTIESVYKFYKNEDNFLYMTYASESTFGG